MLIARDSIARFGVIAAILSGCASDPIAMHAKDYNHQFSVKQNYQATYASLLESMKACFGDGTKFMMDTKHVDGELYGDLGYGTITVKEVGISSVVFLQAKVSRDHNGTLVEFKEPYDDTGPRSFDAWLPYWAKGGRQCITVWSQVPPA